MSLAGKNVIVTGAASGIGLATAQRFAREGANVGIWDLNEEGAQRAAAELQASEVKALASRVDVSSRKSVDAAVEHFHAKIGQVNVLVNNAGITLFQPFMETSEEQWDRVMLINLKSMLVCTQAVLPDMLAAKWGRIINVSSSSAQTGSARMTAYAASKGGVIGFTKALAQELAATGITVNNVPPGFVDTPMLRNEGVVGLGVSVDAVAARSPMGRPGRPENMAAAIAFLASDDADYITGHTLNVNGGRYSS
ncbi:short-chain dehydrogenase [Steroidobacter agaridevorans]|uniref:Short-chain dehydrogenase n=1 Tax=Steroidobacter agaridevorans TaxID=2695856 RepID=A0A829Y931_9GAMM|nr:SDR family NAD(P)-dependent oxidoreductase [Steroidobacter agaridevorans]GFE79834.1 short-chain dehydrogenase [Steroidobacter agaridevorans]GFE90197.1 short-chain dehydrogenase [Steroidobacter agaridevorans]